MSNRPHRLTHRDSNQAEITEALRSLGFLVLDVSPLGGDALDLFVCGPVVYDGYQRQWCQVELKANGGTFTDGEAEYLKEHPSREWPVIWANCVEDILAWFGQEVQCTTP